MIPVVKKHATQFLRHCIGGALALLPNILVFALLRSLGAHPILQSFIAFVVGGQFAFVIHTYWSYRHRDRKETKSELRVQYGWFMVGQALAAGLNLLVSWWINVSNDPQDLFNMAASPLLSWLLGEGSDFWTILYMFYVVPLVAGVAVSFSWTNWKSHSDD